MPYDPLKVTCGGRSCIHSLSRIWIDSKPVSCDPTASGFPLLIERQTAAPGCPLYREEESE